jgi:hypothetical protein
MVFYKQCLGRGMIQYGAESDSKRGWQALVAALDHHAAAGVIAAPAVSASGDAAAPASNTAGPGRDVSGDGSVGAPQRAVVKDREGSGTAVAEVIIAGAAIKGAATKGATSKDAAGAWGRCRASALAAMAAALLVRAARGLHAGAEAGARWLPAVPTLLLALSVWRVGQSVATELRGMTAAVRAVAEALVAAQRQ